VQIPHVRQKYYKMDSNAKGNLGEAKALLYFTSNGYEVYLPFGTASKCDMLVLKDNITQRVSVKSTTSKSPSGRYKVRLRQSKMNEIKPFDNLASDLLFVYIIPEDNIVILESKSIANKNEIVI
jgi:hypothetical protein